MLLFGLISLIQILILPGLVVTLPLRSILLNDRLLLAVPLSFVINYVVVVFLIFTGNYNQLAMFCIFICEIFVLIFIGCHMYITKDVGLNSSVLEINLSKTNFSEISLIEKLFFITVLVCFLRLTLLSSQEIGSVFTHWDAVVSWNRWAIDWFHQSFPFKTQSYPYGTYTYPQLLPILYSVTYAFIGDFHVEQFAKIIAVMFPVLAFITYFRLITFTQSNRLAIYTAIVIFFGIFPGYLYGDLQFSGYADMPMVYFGIGYIYCIFLIKYYMRVDGAVTKIIYLTSIAMAGAALMKQNGMLISFCYPFVVFFLCGDKTNAAKKRLLISLIIIASIVLPWYVYKFIEIFQHRDEVMLSFYTDQIYSVPFLSRGYHGLITLFHPKGWSLLALLFLIGLTVSFGRFIAFWIALPIYCFWAFFLSYDIRNLSTALPAIALIMGYGAQTVCNRLKRNQFPIFVLFCGCVILSYSLFKTIIKTWSTSSMIIIGIFCIWVFVNFFGGSQFISKRAKKIVQAIALIPITILIVVVISIPIKNKNILNSSVQKKLLIGNPELNIFLLDFIKKHPDGQIATSYQMMGFIQNLSSRFQLVQCSTMQQFCSGFSLENSKYFLIGPWCDESVKKFMVNSTNRGVFNILYNKSGFQLYATTLSYEVSLLKQLWSVGLNSLGKEVLYSDKSLPLLIDGKCGGVGKKILQNRNGFSIFGSVDGSILHLSDWVLCTVGGKLVSLTEIESSSVVDESSDTLVFDLPLSFTSLEGKTGVVRLFGLHSGLLSELNFSKNIHIDSGIVKKGLFIVNNQLYYNNPKIMFIPQLSP